MYKSLQRFIQRLILIFIFIAVLTISFFGAHTLYQFQHEHYDNRTFCIERLLINDKGQLKHALFSPDDNIEEVLVGLCDAEREKISMTAFSLTSSRVANALINAKKRNVIVELIVDGENSTSTYSKVSALRTEAIPVWSYPSDNHGNQRPNFFPKHGIMHNKFIIFKHSLNDKSLLWTGSYNFTLSANRKNQENVIIIDDFDIIKFYLYHFELIKTRCSQI